MNRRAFLASPLALAIPSVPPACASEAGPITRALLVKDNAIYIFREQGMYVGDYMGWRRADTDGITRWEPA